VAASEEDQEETGIGTGGIGFGQKGGMMIGTILLYAWGWCGCEVLKRTSLKPVEPGPDQTLDDVKPSPDEIKWRWITFVVLAILGPIGLILILMGLADVKKWWNSIMED